jgi:hypothetical protein
MSGPAATLVERLSLFGETVRRELPALLRHYQSATDAGAVCYVDQPGQARRVRPNCDALEIGAAFRHLPAGVAREKWISMLRDFQDPATGLVPEHLPDDRRFNQPPAPRPQDEDRYNTMIVNYALECLGSSLAHPVANAAAIDPDLLVKILATLDWTHGAWGAGHWIDCYVTCLWVNQRYFGQGGPIDVLFSWLDRHVDPTSGVWGSWGEKDRWLQPVNGFYRLTRGTYAQFGRPLPQPEKAIDTILLHAADPEFFADGRGNACNVLDVVHPLWLCHRQTPHRRAESEAWVRARLPLALDRWYSERGFAFDPASRADRGRPGLQGTEMWLSIIYLMADLLGLAGHLSYTPRGVHRLPPAHAAEDCF